MTPLDQAKQIIASQVWENPPSGLDLLGLTAEIAEAISKSAADEREACAKLADEIEDSMAEAIAERIRARRKA